MSPRDEDVRAFHEAAGPMLEELEAAGIDTTDFGYFTTLRASTVDYDRAAPILVGWLPRIDDPAVLESIVRSLTGQRTRHRLGSSALLKAFAKADMDEKSLKWAIGNALASLAGPADADGVIALLEDRGHGLARQMLCDALARTRDPRAPAVLLGLLDDDSLNGHAIQSLRKIGRWKAFPEAPRSKAALERVASSRTAGDFARSQARKALATIDQAPTSGS